MITDSVSPRADASAFVRAAAASLSRLPDFDIMYPIITTANAAWAVPRSEPATTTVANGITAVAVSTIANLPNLLLKEQKMASRISISAQANSTAGTTGSVTARCQITYCHG